MDAAILVQWRNEGIKRDPNLRTETDPRVQSADAFARHHSQRWQRFLSPDSYTAFSRRRSECGPQIDSGQAAVQGEQKNVNDGPPELAAPMAAAVIDDLENRSDCPKDSNAGGQPDSDFVCVRRDLSSEAPGQQSKNRERYGNEPGMDLEHFAQEQGSLRQIVFPFEQSHEKEI